MFAYIKKGHEVMCECARIEIAWAEHQRYNRNEAHEILSENDWKFHFVCDKVWNENGI
jgi:hypothetical protein